MASLADAYLRLRLDATGLPGQVRNQARVAGKNAGDDFHKAAKPGIGRLGVSIAAVFSGLGVLKFLKSVFDEARESVKVGKLTEAVIKSTGGAAKITAGQVAKLAQSMSVKTGIDDEAIQSAENMLLTFKNVRNEVGKGNDIFNQATGVIVDTATAMNGGVTPSADKLRLMSIKVGKALNDPIKGMTALSRVGVTFDAGQKKQIISMTKSGNIMGAQKLILAELKSEFGGAAAAAADPADKAKVAWSNFKEELGLRFMPILNRFLNLAASMLPKVLGWLDGVGRGFIRMFASFKSGKTENEVATPWERVGFILRSVANIIREIVIPAIVTVVQWLMNHKVVLEALALIIGGVVIGMKLYNIAMLVTHGLTKAIHAATMLWKTLMAAVTLVTRGWAAAQLALNGALFANPIGLIIGIILLLVVAVVLAWKHSQTFRNVVMGAWHGIQAAVAVAWPVIKAVLDALGWFVVNVVGPAVLWLYRNVIVPVWNGIKVAFAVGAAVVLFYFRAIEWIVIHLVGPAVLWLYRNVIVPVWNGIKLAFLVGWTLVRAIFLAFEWIIVHLVGPAVLWFYRNVIVPVWNGIKLVFLVAWNTVVRPIFNAINAIIRNVVAPAFSFLWHNVVVPIWNGIRTTLMAGWVFMRDKMFTPLFNMVRHTIPGAFNTAQSFIAKYWNMIRSAVAAPIKFVVNTVYKGGIKALWDKVAGVLQLPKLPDFNLPGGFASGGILPGRDTGKDNQLIMARSGEGIAVPELVQAIGASRFLDWNRKASAGQEIEGFAKGGIVPGTGGFVGDLIAKGKSLIGKAKDVFAGVLEQFAKPIVNSVINPLINAMPGGNSYAGLLGKAIPRKIVDSIMAKLRQEDAAATAFGGGINQWRQMWAWVHKRFGYATLNSSYRPGDPGYHGKGMAIDIGTSDVRRGGPKAFAVFNAIKTNFKRNILELIYDFARGGAVWNGRDHFFTGPGAGPGTHNDHIHWASKAIFGGLAGGRSSGNLGSFAVARLAYNTARSMGVGGKILLALMEAGLVESGMRNLNYGDRDSVGFLQQRPSQGWPSPMNIPIATRSFVRAALRLGPWRGSAGRLAQAVQRSAFPARYDARQGDAIHILRNLGWRGGFRRGGIIPAGLFDNGGMLMPGSAAINMSNKPEQVSKVDKLDEVIARLERLTEVTSRLGRDFGREMNGVGTGLVTAGRRG